MRLKTIVATCALLVLAGGGAPARAQSLSVADLAGTWSAFQLATPSGPFAGPAVRSYSGSLTFDATGAVTGTLTDDQSAGFTVSGALTVTPAGVVSGTLVLDDGLATPDLRLLVREARLLLGKHTIVGASTILGDPGLFALVKLEGGQTFTLAGDLAGDWNYHEITPSNDLPPAPPAGGVPAAVDPPAAGDATWVRGSITFHDVPDALCTEADLRLADGTVRAQRTADPASFGCAGLTGGGAVTGTSADFAAQMTTDATGTAAQRDLILGLTSAAVTGSPGMVLMSRITPALPPGSFSQADLAGPWRVYLQRVESKRTAATWQVGQTTFSGAGAFTGGTLEDLTATPTVLTAGSLLVSANGSVTGTLSGATALGDLYAIKGTMRGAKDLVTGVVTAQVAGRTQVFHGIVTMVREVTRFDLGQSSYSVTEGGTATITVLRTGNRAATHTVQYAATGGNPGDYQLPASGTLTFGPSAPSATFTIKTNANTVVDGNRSVTLTLANPSGVGAVLGATSSATLGIVDDDKPGTVRLGAATYGVTEAGKNVGIVIQRAGGAASGVVVQFQTADGTAQAGRDYTATVGSVTFNSGETSKTVMVPITETAIVDGSRSFTFSIVAATPPGTVIGSPASAVVTITDNDVAGTLQFSAATYTVTEPAAGSTNAVITVTRAGGMAGGVLVDFATADGTATGGADYTATAGTLTFLPGNTSVSISIPILADVLVEGDETVLLTLSNPQGGGTLGARKTAVLTIKDGQKGVQFAAPTFTATETTATAMITVSRTGPTPDTAKVRYSTSDGTGKAGVNYKPTSGELTFGPGITKATFGVPLLTDKQVRGPQTVLLLLSSPTATALGPLSSAVLAVTDVDVGGTVKLGAPTFSITEAAGSAVITLSRSGGTAGGVTVDFATADQPCAVPPCPGKAQGGFDYQSLTGTVTFAAGETTKTVLIPITNDTQVNGNRAFLVNLDNVQGGATLGTPSSAVVTIVDDDKAGVFQFGAAAYSVTEPASVTGTATVNVTVTRTGSNLGAASVQFATANGTATAGVDYTPAAATLVFGQGETSKQVPVTVLGDGAAEGNETVQLTLSNPGGGATLGNPAAAVLTIVDSVPSARFSAPAYSVIEGATATITVVRGGATTGTLKVNYATADGTAFVLTDYKAATGTLTFGPGVTSLSFTVPTINTVSADGTRTVNLTLSENSGGTVSAPFTAVLSIQDNDAAGTFQFSAPAYTATEGGAAPAVTVTRTDGSGGTVLVRWTVVGGTATGGPLPTTPGADYAPTTGVLTFGPGVTSLKLPLTIVNDTLAEAAETVDIGLTLEGSPPVDAAIGATGLTTLTILDNDNGGTLQFALASQTVAESVAGGKVNVQVTRTGTSLASGVTVDYVASGDTGAVTVPAGPLTFAAGQISALIPVTILNNALAEPDRIVVLTLGPPQSAGGATGGNAPVLGTSAATTLRIVDDEPRVQLGAAQAVVVEGGTATITVTRTGSLTGQVTVAYATGGGTAVAGVDYTPAAGTLTFAGGVTSRTFSVVTIDDGVAGGNRTVGLTLSAPAGASIGATGSATLTIQDRQSAGTIQFAAPTATVVEGQPGDPGRSVRVTVTRTGTNLVGPITVGWSATGGTAASPADFTPSSGTLTFEAGATSQSFDLTAVDDGLDEGTETIVLSLDPPSGGAVLGSPSAMTIFVIDAQQTVAFGAPTFTVGETTPQAVITVVRLGVPAGGVSVVATTVAAAVDPAIQAQAGTDYVHVSTVVTFGAGEIVKTFSVPILTGNASVRNFNRVLGLELSGPVGAALIGTSAATLTILDFRPDLIIASVASPAGGIAGKTLAAPTTVRNVGQVASPAFRVGIFMAKDNGSPDDALPGVGSLVLQRDVPSLAAGASTALPTQLAIAEDLPPGNYFVSAVANFNQTVAEGDLTNNGLSSAPSVLKISSNLSKFQSASATFSLGDAGSGGSSSFGAPMAACDVAGSVNLTGSFTITSQQGDTAVGITDLSGIITGGPFDGQSIRFLVGFTGTADASRNITASLTSIAVSGAFSATGGPPVTPAGSFTGTLTGATLSGDATGTFRTAGGGDCAFTGPLTAAGQTSFVFRFGTRIFGGTFSFGTTPENVPAVVSASGYAAKFHVLFDSSFPDPSAVRFTGPAGSGLSSTPADPSAGHVDEQGDATYVAPPSSGVAPGGVWSVLYKGVSRAFTVPAFDANRSLVVILPRVTLDAASGTLTQVDWDYHDRSGSLLTGPPAFMTGLRVQVWMNQGGDEQPESPDLSPSVTSFNFAAAGRTPPQWSDVNALVFQYADLLGNEYELIYAKLFSIQVQTRLENVYGRFQSPGGSRERLLNVFVDVPFNSVDPSPCTAQGAGPYFVSVRNLSGAAGVPYAAPTCMERTSTTFFPESEVPSDIFSRRDNLTGPTLQVDEQFEFTVSPSTVGVPTQVVVTTLKNDEADPLTDFVLIPNPATPTLKPAGIRLADAKLGQNLTVSWTLPAFEVGRVELTANATAVPPQSGGSVPQFTLPPLTCSASSIQLPTNATSATFKFPASCFGTPVSQAQFCIFVTGSPATRGKTTAGCWFFD